MARVRVKKGKFWDRGSLGLFTAGMEADIDDSLLAGGSGLNNIVDIISLGQGSEKVQKLVVENQDEPVLEQQQTQEPVLEQQQTQEPVSTVAPKRSVLDKLIGGKNKDK